MRLLSHLLKVLRRPGHINLAGGYNALDEYVSTFPTDQNALDIFKYEWSCALPRSRPELNAGEARTFEDPRVEWAAEQLGGFDGKEVLELGPLEGGHTYMLERMGAKSVVAIEANKRAFLKCLVVKEILNLSRSRFLLGDGVSYLKEGDRIFDLCFASGVLYHMSNPAELIACVAARAKSAFFWTHYYDEEVAEKKRLKASFVESSVTEHLGFRYTPHRRSYRGSYSSPRFRGGPQSFSNWMERKDILACLRHFGFTDLKVGKEELDHPAGPAFCIAASRQH